MLGKKDLEVKYDQYLVDSGVSSAADVPDLISGFMEEELSNILTCFHGVGKSRICASLERLKISASTVATKTLLHVDTAIIPLQSSTDTTASQAIAETETTLEIASLRAENARLKAGASTTDKPSAQALKSIFEAPHHTTLLSVMLILSPAMMRTRMMTLKTECQ